MKTKLTLMMLLLACLCCLQASAMQTSQQRLETDYFWFDNPDGIKGLSNVAGKYVVYTR